MLISAQFEIAGLYTYLSKMVDEFNVTPVALLGIVIGIAGGLSALLTNDVTAVAMTPVVLGMCVKRKLNPVPYLLGVAFAANAGSVATLVGSPQNMLIAQKLHLGFVHFLLYAGVPAIAAMALSWWMLVYAQRGQWALAATGGDTSMMELPDVPFNRFEIVKALVVTVLVIGIFIFTDYDKGLVSLTAGCFLLMNGKYDSREMIGKIDWGLLLLFFGLFVVNAAMDSTGIPQDFVNRLKADGFNLQHPATLFVTTAVLSDIVSNVPSVMLLLPYATHPMSGPLIVLASGLSSNMIIIGSLANIIVVDAAAGRGLKITSRDFIKVGLPLSLVSMALGALWVWLVIAV